MKHLKGNPILRKTFFMLARGLNIYFPGLVASGPMLKQGILMEIAGNGNC